MTVMSTIWSASATACSSSAAVEFGSKLYRSGRARAPAGRIPGCPPTGAWPSPRRSPPDGRWRARTCRSAAHSRPASAAGSTRSCCSTTPARSPSHRARRWACRSTATAGSRPSATCWPARSCTATRRAATRRSRPATCSSMTAGAGIRHSELVSEAFRTAGGVLHAVQLWVDLPHGERDAEPAHRVLRARDVPVAERAGRDGQGAGRPARGRAQPAGHAHGGGRAARHRPRGRDGRDRRARRATPR